ncbi:Nucleolar complex protein 2-like protein [Hypsibius exemplaris]|uniref:Nucleolar complex protein 2-like protein n=1 Tax=Hypsibius exemplaris TaxID=2072580 RepID=A0A1W0WHW0_HYPEX|nr:Nucleolar complex protein 2-like protein [Hypsibius exemplaris]
MPKSKPRQGGRKQNFKGGKKLKPKSLSNVKSAGGAVAGRPKFGGARQDRRPGGSSGRPEEKHGAFKKVLMANPKRSFGRNKRHGNADLSDADSLPSESDNESDSDLDTPKKKKQKLGKGKNGPSNGDDSDSDVEQFLNEDEDGEKKEVESSDEEDDEEPAAGGDADETSMVKVTTKMVSEWRAAIQNKPTPANIKTLARAFMAAVSQMTEQRQKSRGFRVDGGPVFNAVVGTCLQCVGPALRRLLRTGAHSKPKERVAQLKKNKKWKLLHVPVRNYLTSVTQLVVRLHDESIVRRVLRHIDELLPFFSSNPKASKDLFKHLVQLWSTGKDSIRLPAFMTLLKFLKMNGDEWLLPAIKKMYVGYVTNSKVTTPASWPTISFMASSLVEIMSIKPEITYQQAFVYIRQMAIHVRNATNQKNKETQTKVYNWPFMHCIYLWSKLLADVYPNQVLGALVHPLVQVVASAIKVNPVRKYYPLMFHCVRALNMISAKTDIFVPTIPLMLTALVSSDLNKKPKATSFKPFDFMCMLKFSESQLLESNYRTGVADQVHELLVEHIRTQCHHIGYPELVVMLAVQLRLFLKECKVAEIARKFKQLLGVIEQQATFVSQRRRAAQIKFTDTAAVSVWEKELQTAEDSPFLKFYVAWKKARVAAQESLVAALDGRVTGKEDAPEAHDEDDDEDDVEAGQDLDETDFWAEAEAAAPVDGGQKEHPLGGDAVDDDESEDVNDAGDQVEVMGNLSDDEDEDEDK